MYALGYQQQQDVPRFERLFSSLLDPLNWVTLRLDGCRYYWLKLVSCWFASNWRHPDSLEFSCLVDTEQVRFGSWVGWQRVYYLSSSLHLTCCLSFRHPVHLSSALWHSQWDERVCIHDVLLRFGRRKTVLVISRSCAAHFLGVEDQYCCICLCLLIRSLLPMSGELYHLWYWSNQERRCLSVRGIAEVIETSSSWNLSLTLSGCDWLKQSSGRMHIFVIEHFTSGLAESELDLDLRYMQNVLTDYDSQYLQTSESDWCHLVTTGQFAKFKMAAKMLINY